MLRLPEKSLYIVLSLWIVHVYANLTTLFEVVVVVVVGGRLKVIMVLSLF